jgi:flagellar protein FlbD
MIELTRLNGNKFFVNCDLIKYAEAAPDTTLTLVTGEKLLVAESCDDVLQLGTAYRAALLRATWPEGMVALSAAAAAEAIAAQQKKDNPPPNS